MLSIKEMLYDDYVADGSGDVCFAYGMNGKCGPECPEFGFRDGCYAEALEYWKEHEEEEE